MPGCEFHPGTGFPETRNMEKKKKHEPGPAFADAAADYLFLLEHRYPQAAVLKLTGDRYKLSSLERSVLYRGKIGRAHV